MPDNNVEMRAVARVLIVVAAISLVSVLPATAGAPEASRQAQATGSVAGTAQSNDGQKLANYVVRIRELATNGNVVGSTTSSTAGQFSFAGLAPGNYMIEVVNAAGEVVGTSAALVVVAGATVNVTVTASAAAALSVAGAGAADVAAAGGAGVAAAGPGINTALLVTTIGAAAGIVGVIVAANKTPASPSR